MGWLNRIWQGRNQRKLTVCATGSWECDATGRHLALKMQVLRVRVSSLPFNASLVQVARRCPAMAKTRVRVPHEASSVHTADLRFGRSDYSQSVHGAGADSKGRCGSDATGRHPALKMPVLGVRFSSPALSEVACGDECKVVARQVFQTCPSEFKSRHPCQTLSLLS